MSTTQLSVEYIIIGFETFIWIILSAFCITDIKFIQLVNKIISFVPVSISLIGVFYIIGIIVDRFSDHIFDPLNNRIKEKYKIQSKSIFNIYRKNGHVDFFKYSRSRIRIFRASVINIPLMTISLVLLIVKYYLPKGFYLLILVLTLGIFFSVCSIIFLEKILESFFRKAKELEK